MINANSAVLILAAGDSPIALARFEPRALRAAAGALLRLHTTACGHAPPWFAKPGDRVMRCPFCMSRDKTYTRWDREPHCTACGGDASAAPTWLVPITDDCLIVMKLCVACRADVTELDLEEEIRDEH